MNRVIKFRGKPIDQKEYGQWVTGCYVQDFERDMQYIDCVKLKEVHYIYCGPSRIEVIPETVGQFTGLHDKYGEEIYEGDKVKTGRVNQYVLFCKGNFVLNLGDYLSDYYKNIEIIGKIHDNPKLLKTENL